MVACDLAVFLGGLRSPPREPQASFGPPNTNRDSALTPAYNVIAMLRKTLTILSLLGLLLTVGLWARSYRSVYSSSIGSIGFLLYRGHFSCTKSGPVPPRGGDVMPRSNPEIWSVRVPIWPIAALFAVALPGIELAHRLRRHRRHKHGLCVKCGYNLKGLSESRCPECNTPFDERLLKKDA